MTDASWGKVWHHLKGFPCDRNVSLNLFREQTNSLFALAQKFTEEILSTKEVFHFFCFWTGKLRLGILGCLWSWYDPNFRKVSFTKYIEFCLQIWRRMVRNLSKLNSGKIQKCYQIVFLPKMRKNSVQIIQAGMRILKFNNMHMYLLYSSTATLQFFRHNWHSVAHFTMDCEYDFFISYWVKSQNITLYSVLKDFGMLYALDMLGQPTIEKCCHFPRLRKSRNGAFPYSASLAHKIFPKIN